MSDRPLPPIEPVPKVTPEKALHLARLFKAWADQLEEENAQGEARIALRKSRWWLAYASTLQQMKPDGDAA